MRGELPERYFYNRSKIIQIGQVLKDILPKRNATDKTFQQIRNAWHHIVGDDVCKCTDITSLKNGVLYVGVESTALIHHLTNFERHAIIARINEIMGMKCIEDIRFKAGMVDGRKK
ncbi:MAG: DUF721 domain-containing protein [Candidatus Brocadia sp.]|nr:DUF721 domain-containing protein [Candidatus Brocadia sp.]